MKCILCNEELTTSDTDNICSKCKNFKEFQKFQEMRNGLYGWTCPRCGMVWAPFVDRCTCPPPCTTTTTNTTELKHD